MESNKNNFGANVIFIILIVLNIFISIIAGIICLANGLDGYFVACLIDAVLGTGGLLLAKFIYNSFFWVIKEKK